MFNKIDELKRETAELQMQAEIKKNLLESDKRYGKPTMEAMAKLSGQILQNEEKLAKLKSLDKTSEKLSLEKQIEKLQKSGLEAMNKELRLDKQILLLQEKAKSGSAEEIKQAKKYASLLEDINSGNKSMSDILSTIAKEDFGSLNTQAEDLAEVLLTDKDIMEELGKERKFADMIDQVKDTLGLVDLKKTFSFGAILAVLTSFTQKILEVGQSLGTSAGESVRLAGNMKLAAISAKLVGGSSQEAEAAITGLVEEFGSLSVVSAGVAVDLGIMTGRFGISGANAAKLLKSMEAISGASIESNISLISAVGELARAEGVAPAQVLNDIAQDTENFAKFAKDGGKNIAMAAIEARKLGLELGTVASIAESLLEFESSIGAEMEASILLGRNLNLNKARELALTGDLAGLAEEVKNQVGSQAEFEAMNVVQRKSLATAIGVTVADLGKMVAGEKTSAALAEEKAEKQRQFLNLQKAASIAQIAGAVGSIWTAMSPLGPLALLAAPAAIAGMYAAVSKASGLEKGGVVKETGMAVVHKGEVFSGTRNEMGMGSGQTNKLLRELIEQQIFLHNRLTNRIGDIALSKAV
jgi:hypothetical protein